MSKKNKALVCKPSKVEKTKKNKYIPGRCPVCHDMQTLCGDVTVNTNETIIYKKFTCKTCTSTWTENYVLGISNFTMGKWVDNRAPYVPDRTLMVEVVPVKEATK